MLDWWTGTSWTTGCPPIVPDCPRQYYPWFLNIPHWKCFWTCLKSIGSVSIHLAAIFRAYPNGWSEIVGNSGPGHCGIRGNWTRDLCLRYVSSWKWFSPVPIGRWYRHICWLCRNWLFQYGSLLLSLERYKIMNDLQWLAKHESNLLQTYVVNNTNCNNSSK